MGRQRHHRDWAGWVGLGDAGRWAHRARQARVLPGVGELAFATAFGFGAIGRFFAMMFAYPCEAGSSVSVYVYVYLCLASSPLARALSLCP